MKTAKATVRLPQEHLELAKRYARDHRMTMTELIDRHLRSLVVEGPIHPEVERIQGWLPADVDARAEHREHLERKHRCAG